jgi:N-acetylglucosaminyldiphosphoundecaprenol N-acetyl-beta-D-mannosaminyltransferase
LRGRADILDHFGRIWVDGFSLAWMLSLVLGTPIPRRSFDMTSVAGAVFDSASRTGARIAIVGGCAGEAVALQRLVENRYPGLCVALARDGYFESVDEERASLVSADFELLVCGMGTPLQEEFVIRNRDLLEGRTVFTCGAFISQSSNRLEYYPAWIDALQLRWMWRLYHERTAHRLPGVIRGLWLALVDSISLRLGR